MYRLELNETQLQLLHNAVEEYFRLRMGQFDMLANDLAFIGFNADDYTEEDFNHRIDVRDDFENFCDQWFGMNIDRTICKDKDVRNAIDIWHVIEHQQWLDTPNRQQWDRASGQPFPTGEEPLMQIERVDE